MTDDKGGSAEQMEIWYDFESFAPCSVVSEKLTEEVHFIKTERKNKEVKNLEQGVIPKKDPFGR